jgi:aspartate/methionine/tyrosine aminotransferase
VKIPSFALERYFAAHEFTARYLLSCSDCEALTMAELLDMADDECRDLWARLELRYTESQGHPVLREAIADIYANIEASNILVAAPEEAIFLLMHALLEAGDHVVVMAPAYQSLHEVARSIGCAVDRWAPDENRGWYFDIASLEERLRPDTRLVVVNFPHNPTGYVPSKKDFQALIELTRERGIYLLADEMYRFLEIDPDSRLPSACELYDNAVSLFGLSKSFGLPGLRIGWLASQNRDILTRVLALKDYTTICNSAPSEILAIAGIRNRTNIVDRQLARLHKNLSVLDGFFDDYADCFSWTRPLGSSVCFPRMLIPQETSTFCDELVNKAGIMLVPSKLFQFGERHVRIGFGRENLPEVISVFASYLHENFQ